MRRVVRLLVVFVTCVTVLVGVPPIGSPSASALVQPSDPLRIKVDEAVGARTVIGQLTVAQATRTGFVTAWDCSDPRPVKSDVNYNGFVSPVASNRLIVTANEAGEVCFYTSEPVAIIVDVFAVTDGITAIPNQRTDTRTTIQTLSIGTNCHRAAVFDGAGNPVAVVIMCDAPRRPAGSTLRVNVPGAKGGKTVVGQLTVAQTTGPGFVTAYGCDDGIPRGADGKINKSDLNYDGRINPVASNRLIVTADNDGDVCFYTSAEAHFVVDINGIADADTITPLANQREDTRIFPVINPDAPECTVVNSIDPDTGALLIELDCTNGGRRPGGYSFIVNVPEAVGGKTVVGQLTMAQAQGAGFFTAYACDDRVPRDSDREINKSDLNFTSPAAVSNRLIVEADDDGNICVYTSVDSHVVVDINGIFNTITAFDNQRTDTRNDSTGGQRSPAGVPSRHHGEL